MPWYRVPRDATLCAHFSVESGVIFTGVWRSILGLNWIIYGVTLLHYDSKVIQTYLYAILARDTRVQMEYKNVLYWAYGYLAGGTIQTLIASYLLYTCLAGTITVRYTRYYQIISAIMSATLCAALIYVIHVHEMRRISVWGNRVPYVDFVLFALPFIGEAFHWYFLMVVRCMWVDLTEANYPVYEYRFNPEEEDSTIIDDAAEGASADTVEGTAADTTEDIAVHTAAVTC